MKVPTPMQGDQTDEELTLLTLSSCVIYLQTDEVLIGPIKGQFGNQSLIKGLFPEKVWVWKSGCRFIQKLCARRQL